MSQFRRLRSGCRSNYGSLASDSAKTSGRLCRERYFLRFRAEEELSERSRRLRVARLRCERAKGQRKQVRLCVRVGSTASLASNVSFRVLAEQPRGAVQDKKGRKSPPSSKGIWPYKNRTAGCMPSCFEGKQEKKNVAFRPFSHSTRTVGGTCVFSRHLVLKAPITLQLQALAKLD
jgi:hypothetical protein